MKRHTRKKDGKIHVYYSISESIRVTRNRVIQRRLFNLGELNTNQLEDWHRCIEVINDQGQSRQMRLFSDREGKAPEEQSDVAEIKLSSLKLKRARHFGDCWLGCKMWEMLQLDRFWAGRLQEHRGPIRWEKVVELLCVYHLCEPGSELGCHQRWFPQSAMGFLLNCGPEVAHKDRLYRLLDKIVPPKEALQEHLTERWKSLFGARFDVLLYDLTSTYFEGQVLTSEQAKRGYSRDHRPDCKQVLLAVIVNEEGFPISYEVYDGNRRDVTTLDEALRSIESKYGQAERIWVFDRGIVSEDNLQILRDHKALYLVGTPRSKLSEFEKPLLDGPWEKLGDKDVQVQLLAQQDETYVLARSMARAEKEKAMFEREFYGLMRSLIKLQKRLRHRRLCKKDIVHRQLGRLQERYARAWKYLKSLELIETPCLRLRWDWDRCGLKSATLKEGAYLLRTNIKEPEPKKLWQQYIQLTEVESVFRVLKSELGLRPIWHRLDHRINAHIMIAFMSYCLWVCLKKHLHAHAGSLSCSHVLANMRSIQMIEVWFDANKQRRFCLDRITEPEPEQQAILEMLGWSLPSQPPPKIYSKNGKCVADR